MSKKIATREAYGEVLVKLGRENPDVVVLDADLAKSTKTYDFSKHFPERFFNMGIAEQNMMGTAAGLAAAGKIPFCSTFAVFATGRAYEQIRNSIAYSGLNVKIAATHAGITVGEDGGSHQSVEDIGLMRGIPGMTVLAPADAASTDSLVRAASAMKGPVYIRLGRSGVPAVYEAGVELVPGRASVLREGIDATIIATGIMVAAALEASDLLAGEGLRVGVIDMFSIKPLDKDAVVAAAQNTGAIVTAEEHSIIGGLGSAVAEVLAENYPAPMKRLGIPDVFGESGTPAQLLEKCSLTPPCLAGAVKEVMAWKKAHSES